MNDKQKMFHDFFMRMVRDGREAEAGELLAAGFRRQDEGTFDAAFLQAAMPKYFELVKPECADQLKKAMSHFASQL